MTPASIRVYYNTAHPCVFFPGLFAPADFDVVSLVETAAGNLNHPDQVFAHLNADDRPGGQSVRSLSIGDVVEINGRMQQCLAIGWRDVTDADAEALRARFGIHTCTAPQAVACGACVNAPPAWGVADAVHRAYDMLEMAFDDLGETAEHPHPNVLGGRNWVVAARAVLAPLAIAWQTATQAVPASFRFTLHDANDDSPATQEVLIFLSEHVEIVVPRPGQTPGIMDPDHEEAVTRVELLDGEVRTKVWDRETVQLEGDATIVTLVPATVQP